MEWLEIRDTLAAFLTPTIGIGTLYIAYQQWQTNHSKFKFERYEKRLRVYEEVRKILSIVMRDANASFEDLLCFRSAVSEADFLFGPEIPAYLDEIYRKGLELRSAKAQYRDRTQSTPPGYDHQKICDQMHGALTWLTSQFEPAKSKFKPYLDVSK